jgi:hypothetical protein
VVVGRQHVGGDRDPLRGRADAGALEAFDQAGGGRFGTLI